MDRYGRLEAISEFGGVRTARVELARLGPIGDGRSFPPMTCNSKRRLVAEPAKGAQALLRYSLSMRTAGAAQWLFAYLIPRLTSVIACCVKLIALARWPPLSGVA